MWQIIQLFAYVATTLSDFVKRYALGPEKLPLGFTFSFPCVQLALNKAFLVRWTKGFDVGDAVNKDVCHLLQTAVDEAVSSHTQTVNVDVTYRG